MEGTDGKPADGGHRKELDNIQAAYIKTQLDANSYDEYKKKLKAASRMYFAGALRIWHTCRRAFLSEKHHWVTFKPFGQMKSEYIHSYPLSWQLNSPHTSLTRTRHTPQRSRWLVTSQPSCQMSRSRAKRRMSSTTSSNLRQTVSSVPAVLLVCDAPGYLHLL